MLRTADLDYHLPEDLIATRPAEPRDTARLMVLSRSDPSRLEHRAVRDLPELLRERDVLVCNVSSVLPARLEGLRPTGGKIGGLFLAEESRAGADAPRRWRVMLRSSRRLRAGDAVALHRPGGGESGVTLLLLERAEEGWVAEVTGAPRAETAAETLGRIGATPLPPYILAARRAHRETIDDQADREWYQTVYASASQSGSVAAPTAGLHFTTDLLRRLRERGVGRAELTLHVGSGTFKPVETEHLEEHEMHEEWRQVPRATIDAVDAARAAGRITVAVGTTSVRALESLPAGTAPADADLAGPTRLMIAPGHRWRRVDALMTNFHLPRSTLLALVAALLEPTPERPGEGLRRLLAAYAEAVRSGYRFYSYGDAMLILP